MFDGNFMQSSSYTSLIEMEIPLRLLPKFPGRRQRGLKLLHSLPSSSKGAARQGDGGSAVVTAVCSSSVTNAPFSTPSAGEKVGGSTRGTLTAGRKLSSNPELMLFPLIHRSRLSFLFPAACESRCKNS